MREEDKMKTNEDNVLEENIMLNLLVDLMADFMTD